MQTNRILNAFVLSLVLSVIGCQSQPDQGAQIQKLTTENEILAEKNTSLFGDNFKLKLSLATEEGAEKAHIDYQERQAGFVAGCAFLVSICPESVTKIGKVAQAEGYGGGTSTPFWVWVIAKLVVAAVFVGSSIGTALFWWVRIARPEAAAVQHALTLVSSVEAKASIVASKSARFEDANLRAKAQALEIQASINSDQLVLAELDAEVEMAQARLMKIKSEYREKLRMTQALNDAF